MMHNTGLNQHRLKRCAPQFVIKAYAIHPLIFRKPEKLNPSFIGGGGGGWSSRPPKGFSSITFEKSKLETPNFS